MIEGMAPARILALALCLLLLGAAGCDGDQAGRAPYRSATTLADWPTYHHDAARSGHVRTSPTRPLRHAWTRALSGAVYGEPLVLGGTLVVATEQNWVYGLAPRTGAVRWRVRLGAPQPLDALPCGNIDPLGITGTPAYDRATGSVFVVAETVGAHHTLWALDAGTGARRWHRSLDVLPDRDRHAEQQRAALLVEHGRVLTAFGGLAGDCGNYVGYVTSVPATGAGATYHFAVPTAREAGIWSTPGPVLGANGHVYVATGNGASLSGRWDRSDSVTELGPVRLEPLSAFGPGTWHDDNVGDLDLGSASPAMVPSVDRVVIAGKRGEVYLLRPSLGGVGSALARLAGCTAYGGAAVSGSSVVMPCKDEDALRLLHVGASSLRWEWSARGVYASPVVAGRHVYAADEGSGDLVVLRLSDGSEVQRLHAGPLPHFPSEVVSGDWVFVPTLDGVTAFRGR